jgi:hypothetical protein
MAIRHRDSSCDLRPDEILARASEEDIFRRYCPEFRQLNVKFRSSLRHDRNPGVKIFCNHHGRLTYKDHGFPEHTFDVFGYVMYMYRCTFKDALRIIDADLGLGLMSGRPSVRLRLPQIQRPVTCSDIRIKARYWKSTDLDYWDSYLIDRKLLERSRVVPISHYWINGTRYTAPDICFAYTEHSPRFKIYAPMETDFKWFGNVEGKHVQGRILMPDSGERIILTSSQKDLMVLYSIGIPALAMQSETQMPTDMMMKVLMVRFKHVDVLYDNDFTSEKNPGQTMAVRISQEYGLRNIVLPPSYNAKDPSDLIQAHGPVILHRLLNEKEIKHTRQEDEGRWHHLQVQVGGIDVPAPEGGECPF